jgi:hypothetical protein
MSVSKRTLLMSKENICSLRTIRAFCLLEMRDSLCAKQVTALGCCEEYCRAVERVSPGRANHSDI